MDISISELTRRIGQSLQNFSVKLKRGTITDTEFVKIADKLNIVYEQSFTLPKVVFFVIESCLWYRC